MSDEYWARLQKREVSDEEAESIFKIDSFNPGDPFQVGILFLEALRSPEGYLNALRNLVTPESQPAWGDFRSATAMLEAIRDMGIGSVADRAAGDDDIAYVKVLSHVTSNFQVTAEDLVSAAAVVTLVSRPDLGMWRVHALGDYVPPADVPHGR